MRDWKKWTARGLNKRVRMAGAFWQAEFFDHVLRSRASYAEKWQYVRDNPVRAGLVATFADWPHAGECERLEFG